jgi:hypothetical protein
MSKKKHEQTDGAPENPGLYFVQKPSSDFEMANTAVEPDPPELFIDRPHPVTPVQPSREISLVSAQIFARVSGIRVDKIAGFLALAKRENLRPRSVAEWHILYQKYLTEPVTA